MSTYIAVLVVYLGLLVFIGIAVAFNLAMYWWSGPMALKMSRARKISEDEAQASFEKMVMGSFTLEDMLGQLRMIRKLGPMKKVLGMMPGIGRKLRVVGDWTMSLLFKRDVSQLGQLGKPTPLDG